MDPMQQVIIIPCLMFLSFIIGVAWTEAGHEVKREAKELERKRLLQRSK